MIAATREKLDRGVILLDGIRGVRAVVQEVTERHGIRVREFSGGEKAYDRTYSSSEIAVAFVICGRVES